MDQLPGEDIIYLGDTAHVPYGDKTVPQLMGYAEDILDFMAENDVKAVVAACNTSSAVSLPLLKDRYSFPVIGIIQPGARSVVAVTEKGRIGVLATDATAKSGAYRKEIQKLLNGAEVTEVGCPRLVPLIEKGITKGAEVEEALAAYIAAFADKELDAIVLGCTHYPYVSDLIRENVGDKVAIIDPAAEMVLQLQAMMEQEGLTNERSYGGTARFYATGSEDSFVQTGRPFLGRELTVKRVVLKGDRNYANDISGNDHRSSVQSGG